MTDAGETARSWLFAPGDSERKMTKAIEGEADIVLIDLEDAIAEESKAAARAQVHAFLKDHPSQLRRLWVRVNPMAGPHTLADLAAVMPAVPGGIMLPKVSGPNDVEVLHRYLSAFEAAYGIAPGTTRVIVLVTETAEAMFNTGGYKGAPRVVALTWGAEDLADALGASGNREEDGSYGFTYELARSLTLLGAAAAGVRPIDTVQADFRDLEGLHRRAEKVRRDGFCGMLAIHPDQVPVINAAFVPSQAEIAEAQAIADLFAANPGTGALGYKGGMVDRPFLARAQTLLRRAAER